MVFYLYPRINPYPPFLFIQPRSIPNIRTAIYLCSFSAKFGIYRIFNVVIRVVVLQEEGTLMNSFFERRYFIQALFIVMAIGLLGRLYYVQLIDPQYTVSAKTNVQRTVARYPGRGPILDRNLKVLVTNEPVYDIMVTPRDVKPFDTLKFCKLLGIDKDGFDKRWKKALTYSRARSSAFEKQLPVELYAPFQEHLSEFPGFQAVERSVREYPDSVAAQFLGYTDEVNDDDIKRSHGYYHRGDYIGRTGVEKSYENLLRGQRGVETSLYDSRGVKKESYLNGLLDTPAVAGERLISSLDIRIQKLGEKLMQNKVGSIVAIEPATGEILCFVSTPTYDPNLMVGREHGNNSAALNQNPYHPFFIRPIQAYYPPGSSFKPLSALIALQEGIITPQTSFDCTGTYWAGNHPVHCEVRHGVVNLETGIAVSCNTYFCNVFDKLMNKNGTSNTRSNYIDWRNRVSKFGYGVKLDVDLPHEGKGYVPDTSRYDKVFKSKKWRSSTFISLAIGQGELEATPLQLANIDCIIANKGYYYEPHLIKQIGDNKVVRPEFTVKHDVGIDSVYFKPVIDGMQAVVERGTAAGSRISGINMVGKTGTAQNPHGKNHSLFVAFAPRDHPRIVVAVVVENSGQGADWAAPIASFIVEKYLRNNISSRPSGKTPEWIMAQNLLPEIKAKPAKIDTAKKPAADSARRKALLKSAANKKKNKNLGGQILAIQTKKDEDK
jgi:penicillin-binding protein 2